MGRALKSEALMLLELEHDRLNEVLQAIEDQLDGLEGRGQLDSELVRQALRYLSDFPDICHHPKEDLIARRLTEALGEARISDDLEADHQTLHDLTLEALESVRSRLDDDERLQSLRDYVSAYRRHLRHENEHFFPKARRTLSQHDFDQIDFQVFDAPDPVFDTETEGRFSALRRQVVGGSRA